MSSIQCKLNSLKYVLKGLSTLFSDKQVAFIMFIFIHRYFPHFKKPRSFSEKVNYIKLYNRNPIRAKITDRLYVREYVKEKVSGCDFIDILWHGKSFSKDIWDKLPVKFVIKANHGSKMIIIVDKSKHSYKEVFRETKRWLNFDYTKLGREWVYKDLDKYLIIEEKLEVNGSVPPDYKFFVCAGHVEMVQVDLCRFTYPKRNMYSKDFELLDITYDDADIYRETKLIKPKLFEEALNVAEKLGSDFDFLRVDLYLINDKIYLGELTNTPGNGFTRISPKDADFMLGSKLPQYIIR